MTGSCSVEGCGLPVRCLSLCNKHYRKARKYGDPTAGKWGKPFAFLELATNYTGPDCLFWPYAANDAGYGHLWIDGKLIYAHRYVCEAQNGPPPTPSHEVAHSCGLGHFGCISGKHLRWATTAENAFDRVPHDTHLRGERSKLSKLTENQVLAIKRSVAVPASELALRYGVSSSNIYLIQAGRSWSWLTSEASVRVEKHYRKGSQSPVSKLTENDVREIRRMSGSVRRQEIACLFNVSIHAVNDVLSGRTWSWLK